MTDAIEGAGSTNEASGTMSGTAAQTASPPASADGPAVPPKVGDEIDGMIVHEVRRVDGAFSVAFAPGGAFVAL
ncbi:hypothetical protein [Bradyrhizobium sp. HKCCYLR1051]|uniref:hypothetical protein n=1 Tax=Bradyrhizobium sp. HKCCYLR1051 TaxID=3420738 RepID=UPI003EB6E1BC